MEIGTCRLCDQNKELCNKSHIIPDFCYGILKDQNGPMIYVDRFGERPKNTGEYEGGILCKDCEGKINKYEDYAAKLIFNKGCFKSNSQLVVKNDLRYLIFSPFDYSRFKLFLLSILWRASISSRPFFETLKLSEEVEDDLKVRLKNEFAGEIYEYPCIAIAPPMIETQFGRGFDLMDIGMTRSPICFQKNNCLQCEFLITGIKYIFLINKSRENYIFSSVQDSKFIMLFNSIEKQLAFRKSYTEVINKHFK